MLVSSEYYMYIYWEANIFKDKILQKYLESNMLRF